MNAEKVVEMSIVKKKGEVEEVIAAMIRQSSEAGQLISEPEILREVADQDPFVSSGADSAAEVGKLLRKLVDKGDDFHELTAQDGSRRYYASQFMTRAYAMILLQKQGDHLRLIAEIVRQNSEVYPRPVPLNVFMQPPFDLTSQEIQDCLQRMTAEEEYRDIVPATTSASRVFLYSNLYLEPEYASMLAEWLDVGQLNNP